MFKYKPDYEHAKKRMDAWWGGEILDRPPAYICVSKPAAECLPLQRKDHASVRERWLDTEFNLAAAEARIANSVYFAEALPVAFPNLGPEIFSAFYGCHLEFGEHTSWSEPLLKDDLDEVSLEAIRLDRNSFYFRKMLEMTEAYVEAARGKFIVGYTDLHGGGDALAAFRDPQQLCLDLFESPGAVKSLCRLVTDDFFAVYDMYDNIIKAAGMPSTSWLPLFSSGKYHIPCNDFSCMISEAMFEEFFLPGIERECARMTNNIYHLDGAGALRHLDRIMEIPNLHAIQWVPGSGRDDWHLWVDVYKKIQSRGKGFIVYLPLGELHEFMDCFKPTGVFLWLYDVRDPEQAEMALKTMRHWC